LEDDWEQGRVNLTFCQNWQKVRTWAPTKGVPDSETGGREGGREEEDTLHIAYMSP